MLEEKRRFWAALALAAALSAGEALANGNTAADAPAPAPIKKSVRKVTAPRPAKKTVRKTAPKKAAAQPAKPVAVSALDRGISLAQQERYEAAQPWLRKAIQENRRSAAAWYWYGMCHERTGRFYEAQYFYSKAVECDPAFEPLSRVVAYPNDGGKTPLWDPKRPARVYPVPTDTVMGPAGQGVTIIPPDAPQARPRPSRPALDPELPKVPIYTPPEPGAMPQDGDAWHPSVYVPPTMDSAVPDGEPEQPVYIPPSTIPQGSAAAQVNSGPAYQPPLPVPSPQAVTYQPPQAPQNAVSKPAAAKKTAARKTTAKKSSSRKKTAAPKKAAEVREAPVEQQQPAAPQNPVPETPPTPRLEYLPPVGQVMPGEAETVPPAGGGSAPLPPVGQGASSGGDADV